MKQILLMFAVVALVGCGESKEEKAAKAKVAAEAKARAWVSDLNDPNNVKIEAAIRKELKKPTGELTKVDLERVKRLYLSEKQLTEVPKEVEKLTKLWYLELDNNQLTDVKVLEKLTELRRLHIYVNRLTKAQIGALQKALPKCSINKD